MSYAVDVRSSEDTMIALFDIHRNWLLDETYILNVSLGTLGSGEYRLYSSVNSIKKR